MRCYLKRKDTRVNDSQILYPVDSVQIICQSQANNSLFTQGVKGADESNPFKNWEEKGNVRDLPKLRVDKPPNRRGVILVNPSQWLAQIT